MISADENNLKKKIISFSFFVYSSSDSSLPVVWLIASAISQEGRLTNKYFSFSNFSVLFRRRATFIEKKINFFLLHFNKSVRLFHSLGLGHRDTQLQL